MGNANEGTGAPHTTAHGFVVMTVRRGAEEFEVNAPLSIAVGQAAHWDSRGSIDSAEPAVCQVFSRIIDAWCAPQPID